MGRGDQPGETALAAATAAIISARWNATSRSAWTPPEQRQPGADSGPPARATARVSGSAGVRAEPPGDASDEFQAVYFDPAHSAHLADAAKAPGQSWDSGSGGSNVYGSAATGASTNVYGTANPQGYDSATANGYASPNGGTANGGATDGGYDTGAAGGGYDAGTANGYASANGATAGYDTAGGYAGANGHSANGTGGYEASAAGGYPTPNASPDGAPVYGAAGYDANAYDANSYGGPSANGFDTGANAAGQDAGGYHAGGHDPAGSHDPANPYGTAASREAGPYDPTNPYGTTVPHEAGSYDPANPYGTAAPREAGPYDPANPYGTPAPRESGPYDTAYGTPTGYDNNPGYDSNAGYANAAGPDGSPSPDTAPGYGTASGYNAASGYDQVAGHEAAPGFASAPGYDSAAGHGTTPGYGSAPAYDNARGYDSGAGYAGVDPRPSANPYGAPDSRDSAPAGHQTGNPYGGAGPREAAPPAVQSPYGDQYGQGQHGDQVAADDGPDSGSPYEPRRSYEARTEAAPVDARAAEASRAEIRPGYDMSSGAFEAVPYDPATGFRPYESGRRDANTGESAGRSGVPADRTDVRPHDRHSGESVLFTAADAPDGSAADPFASHGVGGGAGAARPVSPAAAQDLSAAADGFSPFRPAAPMPSASPPLPSYPGSPTPVSPAYGSSAPVSPAPTSAASSAPVSAAPMSPAPTSPAGPGPQRSGGVYPQQPATQARASVPMQSRAEPPLPSRADSGTRPGYAEGSLPLGAEAPMPSRADASTHARAEAAAPSPADGSLPRRRDSPLPSRTEAPLPGQADGSLPGRGDGSLSARAEAPGRAVPVQSRAEAAASRVEAAMQSSRAEAAVPVPGQLGVEAPAAGTRGAGRRAAADPLTTSSASLLEEPLARADDSPFTSSVMSDLKEPEPFIPEPYDPNAFSAPRAAVAEAPGHQAAAAHSAAGQAEAGRARSERADAAALGAEAVLPKRVPTVPDVPDLALAEADVDFDQADGVERIASFLREQYEAEPLGERKDGYDLNAVIAAVQTVGGVSDARLRFNPGSGGHTLRIEFADGADEAMVTQHVARILREKMGLDADPTALWLTSDESTLDRPTPSRGIRRPTVARAAVPVAQAGARAAAPPQPRMPVPELRPPTVLGGARSDRRTQVPPARPTSGAGVSSPQVSGIAPTSAQPDGSAPPAHPLPIKPGQGGPRAVLEDMQLTTAGLDATIEVHLAVPGEPGHNPTRTVGRGQGPAVDAYLLRLAAAAAGDALDQLLVIAGSGEARARCYIENVAVVPFAGCEVAVVVMLLVHPGFAEQLVGSVIVSGGDTRQAVVRATLSAVNRRLESLLA